MQRIGLDTLARMSLTRHERAYPGGDETPLPIIGLYAWRRDGEHHQWNPDSISLLQHAVRGGAWESYERYAETVNSEATRRRTSSRPRTRSRPPIDPRPKSGARAV